MREADLNTVDLQPQCYDLITAIDVLCQRQIADDSAVCTKLAAALVPGGRLILQVPAYRWLRSTHDDAVHALRRYTRGDVVALLEAAGLTVERITYRVTLPFPAIAALRVLGNVKARLFGSGTTGSDVKQHSTAVNRLLTAIMRLENELLSRTGLPFGSSVFAVGRKCETGGQQSRGAA